MDPNLDHIPNLNAGQLPQARLINYANRLTLQSKRGIVRTRMIAKFNRILHSHALLSNERRVRLSDRTLRQVARKTWLWCRCHCRYEEMDIKRPAMHSWLRVHMANQHAGVFDDAAVLAHITSPSMKEY